MNGSLKRNRVVFTLLVTLALVAAWSLLVYMPQQEKVTDLTSSLQETSRRAQAIGRSLEGAGQVAGNARFLAHKWTEVAERLSTPESADRALRALRRKADDFGLKIMDMELNFDSLLGRINDPRPDGSVDVVQVTIDGRGRYTSIGRFLEELGRDVAVADVENVAFTYREAADPDVYFTVMLGVFVLHDKEA
jgi:hypothetical protein